MNGNQYLYEKKEKAEEHFYETTDGMIISRTRHTPRYVHFPDQSESEPFCEASSKRTAWMFKEKSMVPTGYYPVCKQCLDRLGLWKNAK